MPANLISNVVIPSNPFGATNYEAEKPLFGDSPLFAYLGAYRRSTRESEHESTVSPDVDSAES